MAAAIPNDVFFASIAELNERLKKKEFKDVELVRAFTARMEHLGPHYNALALLLPRRAIKAAKNVDDDMKRERYRGSLQGIPFGAKDLLSVAKEPTVWGAPPYAGQVFDESATVIKKLEKSAGRHSHVEAGDDRAGRWSELPLRVRVHHRSGIESLDITRWSGGSSSGSAIAVAGGIGDVCSGLGNIGVHYYSQRFLRMHRSAPNLWPGEPLRRDAALLDHG